jgi:hypothetical protein
MSVEVDLPAGPVADRLKAMGVKCKLLQNLDDSWSLRFGPLTALEVGKAIGAFIR